MSNFEKALGVLTGVKPYKDGAYRSCCPAHDDKNPSFIISERDGVIHTHCFSGCQRQEIAAAFEKQGIDIGGTAADVTTYCSFTNVGEFEVLPYKGDIPDSSYVYYDAEWKFLGAMLRYRTEGGGKHFRVVTPHLENGKIVLKAVGFPDPRPLFGLDMLAEESDKPVLIVEGEKAAVAARKLAACAGYVVVTWPGGVQSVNKVDWSPLIGRHVVIWPDNDEAGKKAAERIARLVGDAGALSVSVVRLPPGLPPKFDLADPIPENLDIADLLHVTGSANKPLVHTILSIPELMQMHVPEREDIVAPFIKTSSLNMLFAMRGIGKTWIALMMGISVARGTPFLLYDVPQARNVLLIDGEMPLADIKARMNALGAEDVQGFYLLPSEILHQAGKPLNIQNADDQDRIMQALDDLEKQDHRIGLIIFDNLSSLSLGVDENDNTDLETFLRWLVQLRHMGYSVLLIHHAGKSGSQRGASRREDLLDTVIMLSRETTDEQETINGAFFKFSFTKTRGKTPSPAELEVRLMSGPDGFLTPAYVQTTKASNAIKTLRYIYLNKPTSQKQIAEGVKLSEGAVSLHKKELVGKKLLTDDLQVTETGLAILKASYPKEFKDEDPEQAKLPF